MKLAVPSRRFPPLWTVEDTGACFVVIDSAGAALRRNQHHSQPLAPQSSAPATLVVCGSTK